MSRANTIAAIKQIGTPFVSIKEFHLRYVSTKEELIAGAKEFRDAGIQILSGGNIDLKGDDATLRKMFDYAKTAGLPMMVCAPSHATLPKVEALAKEYDIRLAIHNHGPEDGEFPTPKSVLDAIKGMDKRVGLCIDVGHTTRTGTDVVESIHAASEAGRLYDMHLKDLVEPANPKSRQVAVGEGKMPIKEIFQALKKNKYTGGAMLEYEIEAQNPVPGTTRSIEYMRKVIAELA